MSKNIVICCDGTSNTIHGDSTNVLRMYRSLVRSEKQLAFYDAGVGTLSDPTRTTGFGRWLSRSFAMGIGLSVREKACAAYRFLVRNYEMGDHIYLFGFSRGAYTVRTLAGMIHAVGLVRPELEHLAPDAWAVFAGDEGALSRPGKFEATARFKKSFGIAPPARVHFVGAWDTVSSFGWICNLRTTPYTADNPSIDHVRHAVAIDERRALFEDNRFYPKKARHNSFKEVWFAGTHGDAGGGWPEAKSGLAKITLEWMFREAEQEGLLVDATARESFLERVQ